MSLGSGSTVYHKCVSLSVRESLEKDPAAVSVHHNHEFREIVVVICNPRITAHAPQDCLCKRRARRGSHAIHKLEADIF